MLPIKGPGQPEAEEDDEPTVPLRRSHGLTYIRRFLTTKNSWKGKYSRIFCVCEASVLTLNPTTFEVTNEWTYATDLHDVVCTGVDTNDFSITVRKTEGKSLFSKTSKISFSCEHRPALLTALLRARKESLEAAGTGAADAASKSSQLLRAERAVPAFAASLLTETGAPAPVALLVNPTSLDVKLMAAVPPEQQQAEAAKAAAAHENAVFCSFLYEDLEAVRGVRAQPDTGLSPSTIRAAARASSRAQARRRAERADAGGGGARDRRRGRERARRDADRRSTSPARTPPRAPRPPPAAAAPPTGRRSGRTTRCRTR